MTPFQTVYSGQYRRERALYEERIRELQTGKIKTGEVCALDGGRDTTIETISDLEQQLTDLNAQYARIMNGESG